MRNAPPSFNAIPKLGVGVLYNRTVPEFLETALDAVDFIEIIPDMLRVDRGVSQSPRFLEIGDQIRILDLIAERKPMIAHSIGLSIGSAGMFDMEYLDELARWHERYRFPWHSEHLSFTRVLDGPGVDHHAALALPVPCDREILALVAERVRAIKQVVPAPFLLENNVYFADIPDQEMEEPDFLNGLSASSGCGLLLDLHNLFTNARNHGLDAQIFLDRLDLSQVVEVHIAGGSELEGVYIDSHAGPCPDEVWAMLDFVVPRARNLCAVTFEFEESYYPSMDKAGVRSQLDRARDIWTRHH
jgi:uncharacterized protein (UPF0276 family)